MENAGFLLEVGDNLYCDALRSNALKFISLNIVRINKFPYLDQFL